MRALRWHARHDLRLDDVPPPPPPRADQVQLRVLACGICGTDLEELRHGPLFLPTAPHPVTGAQVPLTLGHEVTGQVVAVPVGATLAVGARVAVDGLSSCGHCDYCRRGSPNLCDELASIGLMEDGGLAELVNVPARGCFPLPPSVAPVSGVLIETLAVGMRALRRGRLVRGERVLVLGAGAVGLLCAQAARAQGAGWVGISDPDPGRLRLALELGVEAAYAPAQLSAQIADLAVECSGNPAACAAAVQATVRSGRVVLVGISARPAPLDTFSVVGGERELLGSFSHVYDTDFATAVELAGSGGIALDPLVSRVVPLERALGDGFGALASGSAGLLKVVVQPGEGPAA